MKTGVRYKKKIRTEERRPNERETETLAFTMAKIFGRFVEKTARVKMCSSVASVADDVCRRHWLSTWTFRWQMDWSSKKKIALSRRSRYRQQSCLYLGRRCWRLHRHRVWLAKMFISLSFLWRCRSHFVFRLRFCLRARLCTRSAIHNWLTQTYARTHTDK